MSSPIKLFLFDLAGTTVRDDGFVLAAFLEAAHQQGLRPDAEWVRARMGCKKLAVFQEMLLASGRSESGAEALNEAFERSIARSLRTSPPTPLPGAAEALASCRDAGILTGFTTGFSQSTARPLLAALGWSDHILGASDMVPRGRPAPDSILLAMRQAGVDDPRRVGVAGDTPSDLQAGAAAGCSVILGVGHGSHTLAELAPHPHTHLANDLTTLPELLHVVA